MILNVYAIFDTAAKAFATPFFMHNDGLAIRAFSDNVNTSDTMIAKHPDQFYLYRLGQFDDQTAMFTQDEAPESLGCAVVFKVATPEESKVDKVLAEIKAMREVLK